MLQSGADTPGRWGWLGVEEGRWFYSTELPRDQAGCQRVLILSQSMANCCGRERDCDCPSIDYATTGVGRVF
jgi:hypothetical protein